MHLQASMCLALAVCAAPAVAASPELPTVPPDARTIRVEGSDVVVHLWNGTAPAGVGTAPHYAISLDGTTVATSRATEYTLGLRHGAFDPLGAVAPPVVADGLAAGMDTSLYIVQFVTQPLEAYRTAIHARGGIVRSYVAHHAHIVTMSADAREAVAALPFVRWVGPYHPAYRVDPLELPWLGADGGGAAPLAPRKYNIMVFEPGLGQKQAVAAAIEAAGGTVDRAHAGKFLLEATLTPAQLRMVLRRDEVLYVDRWSDYETDMNLAREITGANFIETVAGYSGNEVRGEVMDVGFNTAHVDFVSRPLIEHTSVGGDSHGASTSGIIFGDGTGDSTGRGLLPDGQGIVASTAAMVNGRYDHTADLIDSDYRAVFQSASVGSARTFFYTTISADHDATLFDFDIVHCQSQSNAGNQDSRPQAWAKNVISGGGIRHQNTLTRNDDSWSGGASIGPASDGRIKPDLCHFYDSTFTVTSGSPTSYTSSFGGTSGATPIICGHVGLFFEMWNDGIFGNPFNPEKSVFGNRCHMTTAKAMLINTATQYDFSGTGHDLTRVHQGWGMPDVQNLWDLRERFFIVDETDLLGNLQSSTYTLVVEPGEPAFKATLVYADPPGNPSASPHRINDVTLRVTTPSGTVYWGNEGLREGPWSIPGGFGNTIDTVENVFVENPQAGTWSVEIIASEVIEDGHVQTPGLDVDYALVVSGVVGIVTCAQDIDGDGIVGFGDVLAVFSAWGPCAACPEDLDSDGNVGFGDLLAVLGAWGPC